MLQERSTNNRGREKKRSEMIGLTNGATTAYALQGRRIVQHGRDERKNKDKSSGYAKWIGTQLDKKNATVKGGMQKGNWEEIQSIGRGVMRRGKTGVVQPEPVRPSAGRLLGRACFSVTAFETGP